MYYSMISSKTFSLAAFQTQIGPFNRPHNFCMPWSLTLYIKLITINMYFVVICTELYIAEIYLMTVLQKINT